MHLSSWDQRRRETWWVHFRCWCKRCWTIEFENVREKHDPNYNRNGRNWRYVCGWFSGNKMTRRIFSTEDQSKQKCGKRRWLIKHTWLRIFYYPDFTSHWESSHRGMPPIYKSLLRVHFHSHFFCQLSVYPQWHFMLESLLFKKKLLVLLYPSVFCCILIPDTVSWITFASMLWPVPTLNPSKPLQTQLGSSILSFCTLMKGIWI